MNVSVHNLKKIWYNFRTIRHLGLNLCHLGLNLTLNATYGNFQCIHSEKQNMTILGGDGSQKISHPPPIPVGNKPDDP